MGQTDDSSIMVIGNNAHFCYLMRRYIRKSKYQILFSTLGDEALILAQREKPDAIILEAIGSETLSWRILHALKGNPETQAIPVVLCSWHDETKHGIQEGANVCLCMPILFDDFQAALTQIGVIKPHAKEISP